MTNDRNVIGPLELDLYIPSLGVSFEYHGDYYHSYNKAETKKQRYKHHIKATKCCEKSINLIQIFEHEWLSRTEVLKSMILHKLHRSTPIYARKCKLEVVRGSFFEGNHLYGNRPGSITYGLVYGDNVVCAMSFARHQSYEWEIMRFSNKVFYNVVGGASKILSHFIKMVQPKSILTFADRRFGNGNLYSSLGFTQVAITEPGYRYWKSGKILSRYKCQKSKLHRLLANFDCDLTESENMFNHGYRRLWDAGHIKFLWCGQKENNEN